MNERVSVTELIDFMDCRRKWSLRHAQRLQPKQRPPNLATGTVVHAALGAALSRMGQGIPAAVAVRQMLDVDCETLLSGEFAHDDEPDKLVQKYLPGVKRALAQTPAWLWAEEWHVEEECSLTVQGKSMGGQILVVGRPDLYRTMADGIELVEIKTTAHDPLDYLLWNPQHRYYAAMLQAQRPEALITFRYLCLPTQGKFRDHTPWAFTRRALDNTLTDLSARCALWSSANAVNALAEPNEAARCKWCDFSPICAAHIAGADMTSVMAEQFVRRPGGGTRFDIAEPL